jgi:predicted transcriptional regulator
MNFMTKQRQLTVKVGTLKQSINEFKNIWKRHEKGEKIKMPIETLRFENTFMLMKTLTPRRLELLQQLHALKKMSIRALSKKLEREYSNVHDDVKALHRVGLVLQDDAGKYFVPWNKIVTEIPMIPVTINPIQERRHHQRNYTAHHVAHH